MSDFGCSNMHEMVENCLSNLQEKARKKSLSGISSGYRALDKKVGGFENGKVYVIGGSLCMGKEDFMLSMIDNMIWDAKLPILLFSTNQRKSAYFSRLMSIHFGIPTCKMDEGCLEIEDWLNLDKGIRAFVDAPLLIHDSMTPSLSDLMETTRNCVREKGIRIVFIDCLQMIDFGKENGDSSLRIAKVLLSLKEMAIKEDLPVIIGSMLSKETDQKEKNRNRRPDLMNLPDSNYMEEFADVIMFVHRPEQYRIYKDENGQNLHGKIQILVRKNAFRPVCEITLHYQQKTGAVGTKEEASLFVTKPAKVEEAFENLMEAFDLEEVVPF